ncbi:hypothetical protein JCM33374_g4853 [Metschnikowia sp. JCM 33374]|nr:hypothetical protein JCM33374_g4853 [Metschnikowia sp. JCM 33374]
MDTWYKLVSRPRETIQTVSRILKKYASFIGPGIMVSVAYMDPGNYSTAVASGADYKYSLLVVVFMSNVFAVILQCLCVKLGSVTGLDLAEMCRLTFPWWLNLFMYVCSEFAIVATDLAEVIGTAIALEIIFGIPIIIGTFITVLDVLCVLLAYHKDGTMRQTRLFEIIVTFLVAATCICFIWELFSVEFAPGSFGEIVKGFLPLDGVMFRESNALFLSCGIVGSTVMPHSLFLGSSIVQSRLKDYDIQRGHANATASTGDVAEADTPSSTDSVDDPLPMTHHKFRQISDGRSLARKYKPSYAAIKHCLTFSYTELILSLFIIAVFVNAAILIVAGATLHGKPDADDADLLSIYELLSHYISPAAGLVFALSMLFSGQSAGIVCTMAGQIISEGFINWSFKPWVRRLVTRVIAIVPVVIFMLALGREGVSTIMNLSQVVLSFILPVVSAPLIYFTATKKYMTVYELADQTSDQSSRSPETTALLAHQTSRRYYDSEPEQPDTLRKYTFENSTWLNGVAMATWLTITFLNLYLIYLFSIGVEV